MNLMVGDQVNIVDNGKIFTHITPRWTYGYSGIVVRSNRLSYSIKLTSGPYQGEVVRVNEEDLILINTEASNDSN